MRRHEGAVVFGVDERPEKFDEKLTDVFAVEDSISEQLVSALMLELSSSEKKAATSVTPRMPQHMSHIKGLALLEQERTPKHCD